ncbi:MAG: hypothetical protein GY785_19310 [Gammaproteobacteria bacterium]|nr:hypothetical protein [Gammaproteobacteria bacterium]MCP4979824.1 hypothetical protein [Gammaproteobacteria bacterium]
MVASLEDSRARDSAHAAVRSIGLTNRNAGRLQVIGAGPAGGGTADYRSFNGEYADGGE